MFVYGYLYGPMNKLIQHLGGYTYYNIDIGYGIWYRSPNKWYTYNADWVWDHWNAVR